MKILAIDPGTTCSGWAVFDTSLGAVVSSGVSDNCDLLPGLHGFDVHCLAIEVFEARGMPIGNDSIQTIIYTGRIIQEWESRIGKAVTVRRSAVKLHLCGSSRAKDGNVRQALIDKLGPPGTKKAPGGTYGVSSHAWAALAVAVTAFETGVIK